MFDLRTALRVDAVASGALGVGLLLFSTVLDGPLGLPVPLSLTVGALLLVWAAFVGWVAGHVSAGLVKEVIALNVVYVGLSVLVAVSGWIDLTGLGVAFVLVQAGAVVTLTVAQFTALRRAQPTPGTAAPATGSTAVSGGGPSGG